MEFQLVKTTLEGDNQIMTSTPMERIKAYHSIKPFVSKDELVEVSNMLKLTEVDRTKRIEGKEAEFEFLLMCHTLGNLQDIVAFEEGVSRLTNTVTTDFLFITKDNKRLAIEVKSTTKKTWKISESVLSDKEDFAKLMNAELYFAIRLANHWVFLPSDYIKQKNKKITVQDILNSELNILGEKSFIILKSLTIKSTYTTDSSKGIGIENKSYGFLNRYSLEVEKKSILKVSPSSKAKSLIYTIILEAVQDSASNQSQEIKQLDTNRTLVIEKLNENCQFQLSHFLLAPIRHITHDLHDNYDLTTYITENIDNQKEQLIHPNMVMNTLGMLHNRGLTIAEVIENNIYFLDSLYELKDL